MVTRVLDLLIAQASTENWRIKYIAMNATVMSNLVSEVTSFTGKNFKVDTLSMYKEVPLKVKDILDIQVAYEINFE